MKIVKEAQATAHNKGANCLNFVRGMYFTSEKVGDCLPYISFHCDSDSGLVVIDVWLCIFSMVIRI